MRRLFAAALAAVLLLLGGAVAFPDSDMPITVEAAFGADLTADPGTWSYTDISTRLTNVPITKRTGRSAGAQQADAGSMSLTLDNSDGALTPLNPMSTYYPDVVLGLPIRVTINPTGTPTVWFSGYADSWTPDLIPTTEEGVFLSVVRVTASGILRRLSQGTGPLRSALFRSMAGVTEGDYVPLAYWPMEDGSDATSFVANTPGVLPGLPALDGPTASPVVFAGDSSIPGAGPVALLPLGAIVNFYTPVYTSTGSWAVQLALYEHNADTRFAVVVRDTAADVSVTFFVYASTPLFRAAAAQISTGSNIFTTDDTITAEEIVGVPLSLVVAGSTASGGTIVSRLLDADGATIASTTTTGTGINMVPRRILAETVPAGTEGATTLGHVAVFVDPAFGIATDGIEGARAAGGWAGEQAHERAERLCREERVPITITGSSSQAMGAQTTGTLLENLQECEVVNTGGLGEDGFGLHFICLPERYNRPVDLTIDLATYRTTAGTSAQVLRPIFDDQQYRNRWVVNRPEGSEAIADLSSGNLLYEDSATANVETDDQLPDQAWWRAYRDSIVALRYANTPLDLAANPSLIDDWLSIVPGLGRIVRTGLPPDHIPDDIDEMVDGISETLERRSWTAQYNGSPASAYIVAELDDDTLGKLDTDGAALVSGVSSSATTLTVATTTAGSPLWTTDAGEMPIPLVVSGEVMSATAVASAASDTYQRTEATGLGTATSGQTYSIIGTAAEYSVNGSNAVITPSAVNNDRGGWIDVGSPDQHARIRLNTNTVPTGGTIEHGLLLRVADAQNFYRVTAQIAVTTGLITLNVSKRVANSLSTVATLATPFTMSSNDVYLEASVIGSDIRARVYNVAVTTVPGWMHVTSDSSLTSGNGVGIFFRRNTSNTAPTSVTFDSLEVFNPQIMTVTRSVNGVVKSQAAGAASRVNRPARAAL